MSTTDLTGSIKYELSFGLHEARIKIFARDYKDTIENMYIFLTNKSNTPGKYGVGLMWTNNKTKENSFTMDIEQLNLGLELPDFWATKIEGEIEKDSTKIYAITGIEKYIELYGEPKRNVELDEFEDPTFTFTFAPQ